MDYLRAPFSFRIRKAARYLRLYGWQRTWIKVRGRRHMDRRFAELPARSRRENAAAHVGLIGCGNYAYSVIAYYLRKNFGRVIRGCMDIDDNRAASLAQDYDTCYYTTDADQIINDPAIDLVFIASNHASHAEYAIAALRAGKNVHIEKPHVVNDDQLSRLLDAARASRGKIVSVGYNRPQSPFANAIAAEMATQSGPLLQSWFVSGHEIAKDHWYHNDGEGGRVLGNLCHWTDFSYRFSPEQDRYPITISAIRPQKDQSDLAVSIAFGTSSVAQILFAESKGHAFEGVRERYTAQRGEAFVALDDFANLTIDRGARKRTWRLRHRDHGHEASVRRSYLSSRGKLDNACSLDYVHGTAELFLRTREAVETGSPRQISAQG